MSKTDSAATVLKLICRGLDRDTILAYAAENHWSETPKEIDDLMEAAFVDLAKHAAEVDLEVEFGISILRLNRLFMDSMKVQDLKTALAVQKEINKMLELKSRAANRAANRNNNPSERQRLSIVK
jgi:hypothetical protein